MAISLQKGANVSLSKEAPGLSNILVGLGWDARSTDGKDFDLDASAILADASGKVRTDADFIFYGNKTHVDGSVSHLGDNLTGAGDGDDEQITVNLAGVAADVDKIVIAVSIYDAVVRAQSFGQVRNAYVRIVNAADGVEIARYDLSEDYATETALVFAEVYRNGADWKFRAVGQGYTNGLEGIARDFGVSV